VWLCASSWIPGLLPGLSGIAVFLAAWLAMLRNSYRAIPRLKISAWLILVLVVVILAILPEVKIPTWLLPFFQAFKVPTDSMAPTVLAGDRVLVDKCYYWFAKPRLGDIVAVQMGAFSPEYPQSVIYLKRIVGMPGDKIEIFGRTLHRNEGSVNETFARYSDPDSIHEHYGPFTLPQDHYFLMGDNRDKSRDSRWWGPVHQSRIVGRLSKNYWPLYRAGLVHESTH